MVIFNNVEQRAASEFEVTRHRLNANSWTMRRSGVPLSSFNTAGFANILVESCAYFRCLKGKSFNGDASYFRRRRREPYV